MTDVEAWGIALSAIAAVASVGSVAFWLVDRHRQKVEAPLPDVHVEFTPWHAPWHSVDRIYGHLVLTNAGDALARHFEIKGDNSFRLEHSHDVGKLAALAPGGQVDVPVSWHPADVIQGEVWWVSGRGKSARRTAVGCAMRPEYLPEGSTDLHQVTSNHGSEQQPCRSGRAAQ